MAIDRVEVSGGGEDGSRVCPGVVVRSGQEECDCRTLNSTGPHRHRPELIESSRWDNASGNGYCRGEAPGNINISGGVDVAAAWPYEFDRCAGGTRVCDDYLDCCRVRDERRN